MPHLTFRVVLTCLILALSAAGGCIVVSSHKTYPPAPCPTVTLPHTDAEQIAMIDGYAALTFDSDQKRGLTQLARAHNLTPAAQQRLIDAGYQLTFDSSRAEVLTALAGNPCLVPAARTHLIDELDRLNFDSYRKEVLKTLAANPGAVVIYRDHPAGHHPAAAEHAD